MFTDINGAQRLKINLHLHTTDSDGRLSPERAAAVYRAAGYDIIAVTDHWHYRMSGELSGLRVLGGAEYNIGGGDGAGGVFHILGLGCEKEPALAPDMSAQQLIDGINACGGLAVLAHPAWSLNTVDQAAPLHGIGATEIYNSVSDAHESCRPYSGDFVDTAACRGMLFPLLATDDVHFYDGTDDTKAWIMLECAPGASDAEILQAIREKKFYATQGPEVHLTVEGDEAVVRCSPVNRISFCTNGVWGAGHGHHGEGLTQARCKLREFETFVRAEVTDAQGRAAWTNTISLR